MYFLKRLKFLLTATNQHGVHSPFVYAFVTKCLYTKTKYSPKKSTNTLLKMLDYFKSTSIQFTENNSELTALILKNFPKIQLEDSSNDFLYFEELNQNTINIIQHKITFQNNSIVFINSIYTNYDSWKKLIQLDKIKVSVDTFYCGILFFRREQVKEHFKIRI